tara:strand:+ start:833 stop:1279 length:447 start_codon:yes stop_codon:yes gene_type:complete
MKTLDEIYIIAKKFINEYEKSINSIEQVNKSVKITLAKKETLFKKEVVNCYKTCLTFFPEHLHKNEQSSLDTIEKLNRLDKVPFEDIIRIVKAVREDEFWSKNFLSLTKLRKKKDGIMYIVSFNEKFKPSTKQKSASDILMERYTQNL